MNIKLSESETKNLEELINSEDLDCLMLANEIVSTLDKELQLKYQVKVYDRMLCAWFKNKGHSIIHPFDILK